VAKKIALSDATKQLMAKLINTPSLLPILIATEQENTIEQAELVRWLNERPQGDKKNEFLLRSLSVLLLKDLHNNMLLNEQKQQQRKKPSGWLNKLKYWLLAIAGIIFFGCEGFDGITAMLEVFTLTPIAILATGCFFSLLAIIVFCAFDLVEIAKNLGIKNKNAPQLLDIYLREIKLIDKIREQILSDFLLREDMLVETLRENLDLVRMLQAKHKALDTARTTIQELGSRPALQAAKSITAAVAGVIFFSGGFFVGQTVALKIAELCFTAVASNCPPIVFISFLIGVAAFGVYWYVERQGIENLIASYVGLDQEKIDELCAQKAVHKQTKNLQELECALNKAVREMDKQEDLSKSVSHKKPELVSAINNQLTKISNNRYAWLVADHRTSKIERSASDSNLHIPTVLDGERLREGTSCHC
jgi:hypothetical protein